MQHCGSLLQNPSAKLNRLLEGTFEVASKKARLGFKERNAHLVSLGYVYDRPSKIC